MCTPLSKQLRFSWRTTEPSLEAGVETSNPAKKEVTLHIVLIVQFFADRVWVVVATDGCAGTVVSLKPDPDLVSSAQQRRSVGRRPQQQRGLTDVQSAAQLNAVEGNQTEAIAQDDEEDEYLRSIQPLHSLPAYPGAGPSTAIGAGKGVPQAIADAITGTASDECDAEVLLGLRDDPLTNIVAQRIGGAFALAGETRPLLLTLGFPNQEKAPIPLKQRATFISTITNEVMNLARGQGEPLA
jgi:hypothetical protein